MAKVAQPRHKRAHEDVKSDGSILPSIGFEAMTLPDGCCEGCLPAGASDAIDVAHW